MTQRCMRALYRPWAASFCFGYWPLRDLQARHAMMKLLFFLLFCCEILFSWSISFIRPHILSISQSCDLTLRARKQAGPGQCLPHSGAANTVVICGCARAASVLVLELSCICSCTSSSRVQLQCSCTSNILFRASAAGCATARPGIPSLSHFFYAQKCRIPPLPKLVLCSSGCAGRRCRWRQRHRSCHAFGGNVSKTQSAAAATRITRHS